MSSILNKASRNFLYRHPWQLCLAILGITLGVAVVVAIDLTLDSSLQAFTQTTQALSGKATHRIVASDGGLDEKLYTALRVEHGIRNLSPAINGYVVSATTPEIKFKIYAIDPMIENTFQSDWQQQEGTDNGLRLISEANTVLMNQQTAEKMGLQIDDHITVITDTGTYDLIIIDWLPEDDAVTRELFENLLITDIATAQEILGLVGNLSAIDVIIAPDLAAKIQAIRQVLPADVLLISLDNQAESLKQMTHAFAINLNAMGLLSLLVGMFLIYNTMTFLVIQRRGLIGNLRSIGVTRQQIFKLIISEALILALIGTTLGLVLGILLGQSLLHIISGTINAFFFRVDHSLLILSPVQIAKGLLLGVGATLLAVIAPAWEATRQSPQHTLLRSQLESGVRKLIRLAIVVALFFILCSFALIFLSGTNVSLGLISIFLLLFGFALLTPVVTLLLMNFLEQTLGRYSSIVARLPVRMVKAEISRTGIAIATLMIAVAVSIGMDIMIGSFRLTVAEWLQTSLQADLYVNVVGNTQATHKSLSDQKLKASIAGLEDVEMLSSVLHTQLIHDQKLTKVSVFELNEKSRQGFIFKQKGKDVWGTFIQQNSLFVTEPYAYHHHTKIGDKILLRTDQGEQAFEVIAIYADYSGDQGHLAMSRNIYEKYWLDLGYSGIGIYADQRADRQQLEMRVKQLLKPYQSVRSEQAIFQASMQMFEQTFKITEILRLLAASIAFIGVFSALMALQFERTRQLGILRAIGMTPIQIGRIISIETGLMGLIAGVFAVPVGFIMAYVLIFVVYQRSFGWTMAFHFDALVIVQALLLAFFAALLAGVLPALKMAQTKPAEALRSE
ncbi:FtsX-like permease family protein [Methyloprofundus sp.]|uniref:FtsX-like permease family protein n=1 Tax=Methyloprofundus sp. TaxID=2020875 RepID=UPI003D13296E